MKTPLKVQINQHFLDSAAAAADRDQGHRVINKHLKFELSSFYYAPNFEEVYGHIASGLFVRRYMHTCVGSSRMPYLRNHA